MIRYTSATMARISMVIPDADLAAIDEIASPNRTAFMLAATREAVARVRRQQLDDEIARCLAETSDDDLALLHEFDGVAGDGL
jgi:metal-responsive CopG/Arc/MetJ family transcriptional regulator